MSREIKEWLRFIKSKVYTNLQKKTRNFFLTIKEKGVRYFKVEIV